MKTKEIIFSIETNHKYSIYKKKCFPITIYVLEADLL